MDVNEVLETYSKKIQEEIGNPSEPNSDLSKVSKDYESFKKDMMPELSKYERRAKFLGSIITVRLSLKDEAKIRRQLEIAHLNATPGEVAGFAISSFIIFFVIGIFGSFGFWLINPTFPSFGSFPFLFLFLTLIAGFFLAYYFYSMPSRLAIKWKLKASSQMVPAILYTVIYMKHTSNLERAIEFVSLHVGNPLGLDLKKVLWDVETGRFSSVKDSLDHYLEFWRESNLEFIESFHLIESSLYEPDESRRIQILERALTVILDGVYEKMLRYTHNIKSPLTNVYMLGIVLPTLGLALLPLASTLLSGSLTWVHVFLIFNLIIPFFVFYLTSQILLSRPGGYGESSLVEQNPLYYKYASKKPYYIAFLICFPILLLGLLPLMFGYTPIPTWLGMERDYPLSSFGLGFFGDGGIFDFRETENGIVGPFGFFALILSLLVPFSIALFFIISYSMRTKDLIKERDKTKILEKEFNNSLFTLGNRLGDGLPAEIAFSKVAESTKGQKTEEFFRIVSVNIQSMGMGIEEAIFNKNRGAIIYYPSELIATSMKILIESVKKGLKVAAQSLMSISDYVRNIYKINDRLRDLLAEVISDMKSNMNFLAPLLAGIVVGLSAMITGILGQLKFLVDLGQGSSEVGSFGTIGGLVSLFDIAKMIPPYFLQIAIGLYIIQIIFILTETLVVIDAGEDKLKKTYDTSRNMMKGIFLYLIIALISIISLSALARVALGGLGSVG